MTDIDILQIQTKHYKSPNDAFEKLCRLLFGEYGIERDWDKVGKYIFKGGVADAGVESYWKFQDGQEYCLQAKFTTVNFDSILQQATTSIESALAKHSNLTKYYICGNCDKSDARDGKKHDEDKWNDAVERWKELPNGANVEFIYWGKSEIEWILLQPKYSGLREYFFNKQALLQNWFQNHQEQAIIAAGNRYTEKIHQENDNIDKFKIFAAPANLIRKFHRHKHELLTEVKRCTEFDLETLNTDIQPQVKSFIINNNVAYEKLLHMAYDSGDNISTLDEITKVFDAYYWNGQKYLDENKYKLTNRTWEEHLSSLMELFEYKNAKTLLLMGTAGVGKTHFLCDFMQQASNQNMVSTVVIMGHTLSTTTDVLEQALLDKLDGWCDFNLFLNTLNAYAQLQDQNAIFIIDGLNEWYIGSRSRIREQLQQLIHKLQKYSNIKLIVSYRMEYLSELSDSPKHYPDMFDKVIEHYGFSNPIKSFYAFLDHYNVRSENLSPCIPDYSNPLIVKLICETYQGRTLPASMQGIKQVFQSYIENLEQKISEALNLDPRDMLVSKVINITIKLLIENNYSIDNTTLKNVIKDIDPNCLHNWRSSILFYLEKEGVIVISTEYVYVAYQRLGDYLVARHLVDNCATRTDFCTGLKVCLHYYLYGILEFLAIIYAEKYKNDFILDMWEQLKLSMKNVDSWHQKDLTDNIIITFISSLSQRSPDSVTDKSIKLLESIKKEYNEEYWRVLIECASIPNHPLNAEYLHNTLSPLSMADIDADWTQFISQKYNDDYDPNEYAHSNKEISLYYIVSPYVEIDASKLSRQQAYLLCILFLWLTTTTHRKLRELATLACVNILRIYTDLIVNIYNKFKHCNDLFQQERLYVMLESVTCFVTDKQVLSKLCHHIYENVFNTEIVYPNIIIRRAAHFAIKNAEEKGIDITAYNGKIYPPYNYPIIPVKDKAAVEQEKKRLEDLYEEYGSGRSIYQSACFGDFAVYGVSSIDNWCDTTLNQNPPINKYANKMQDSGYDNIVNRHTLWICNKAYGLGWDYNKHGKFDEVFHSRDCSPSTIERIGKKYQWLAYHEYLCNLADNYHYDGMFSNSKENYITIEDMCGYRDSDPTTLVYNLEYDGWSLTDYNVWRRPHLSHDSVYSPNYTLEQQIQWLHNVQPDVCKGDKSIIVPYENEQWIIVYDSLSQREEKYNTATTYNRKFGMFISAIVMPDTDKDSYIKMIKQSHKQGTNGFKEPVCTDYMIHNVYQAESPIRHRYIIADEKLDNDTYFEIAQKTLIQHLDKRESAFYKPHYRLIELLDLKIDTHNRFQWNDNQGNPVIKNVILETNDNPVIAHKNRILKILKEKSYSLVIKIAVKKCIIPDSNNYHSNTIDGRVRKWHYHLTTYEFAKNQIQEIFHHTYQS